MKGFLLSIAAFAVILLVLNLGYYQEWFRTKPLQYWSDFLRERTDTADQFVIRTERYGFVYTVSMRVRDAIRKKKLAHPVILFEPNSYYRDSLRIYPNIRAPEPSVFYYYTGLEGVWTNSPNVNKANFLLRISRKGAALDTIRSPQHLQEILARYKKYPPIL
ncbi:MAG TPA: hypothetical protein VNW04_13280 [Puia sp.]|jgi:hypothetical protein|nr:hypothetical protein [Puia sp.]